MDESCEATAGARRLRKEALAAYSRLFDGRNCSFGARSRTQPIWQLGVLSNVRLFAIVFVSFSLQIGIHHVPLMQDVFGLEPISAGECLGWIALGGIPFAVLELRKVVLFRKDFADLAARAL